MGLGLRVATLGLKVIGLEKSIDGFEKVLSENKLVDVNAQKLELEDKSESLSGVNTGFSKEPEHGIQESTGEKDNMSTNTKNEVEGMHDIEELNMTAAERTSSYSALPKEYTMSYLGRQPSLLTSSPTSSFSINFTSGVAATAPWVAGVVDVVIS